MVYVTATGVLTAITGFIIFLMYREAEGLTLTEETISIPAPVKNKDILFITDLHRRALPDNLSNMCPDADIVLIGGDLAERGVSEEILKKNLQLLTAVGDTFFVWGNNDYEFGEEELSALLSEAGVTQLINSSIVFRDGESPWTLAGTSDLGSGKSDVYRTLINTEGPVLLLTHNPDTAFYLPPVSPVTAVLAGHTHGGQIRLGPLAIAQKGGWSVINGYRVFTSNGYGTTRLPFRLGAPPNIHFIRLRSSIS